ncbi:methyl-accepting chemotaxis protein [Treponema sp.]|uniref:methyl-accepting chemotaxis protein n=1 Tax=Treponema sp. TaxID=166 RepID=UPI00388DF2E2
MTAFRFFVPLIFISTYLGIFFLRIFHFGFIYERPGAIIFECIPTISISFFLILGCVIAEKPILSRFEKVISKGKKDKNSITQEDIATAKSSYKKFDIAIAIGEAIGFLLGAGSTSIIESAKGIVPFDPIIFIIIELQSVGTGFLCYTLVVFLTKKIFMANKMREIGIEVSNNLSKNLTVAVGTCVYISLMNMVTVPINLIKNPGENSFSKFLVYALIGSIVTAGVCFCVYNLIIKKIQRTERETSTKLLKETSTLATATKESAETSQNQSAAVKQIVATMQDSTILVSSISEKIQHVTSLAEKSRQAVMSGQEALQNNVNELLNIKNTNNLTIEGIKELNKKISSIWDIVSIINVVADQTKIIAFNAELEASSSGEAGKNFHIVATEIRRLSDNIIDSIKEIKERITEIQKASDTLILDSEKGTQQIDSGYECAQSLETGFESIMQSSNSTADSSHEILEYVGQFKSSSEQIFITLKQIADGIKSLSDFNANISSSSENVRQIAGLL